MFTLEGDQYLEELARRLEEAPQRVHDLLAQELQDRLTRVVDDQFADGVDPTGAAYIPPKDGGTPMVRSGALRANIRVVARSTPDGVEVSVVPGVPWTTAIVSPFVRPVTTKLGAVGWAP